MNLLVISILAVASLSLLPTKTLGAKDTQELFAYPISALTESSVVFPGVSWQEGGREVLIRNERGAKNNAGNGSGSASSCRYVKSPWTDCDSKTNTRSRIFTLKKGEDGCLATRTIQKKCKKACRYDKGAWSDCTTTGQMSRTDKLKSTSDSTCQATRTVNKNCKSGNSKDKSNKERKNKDKGARKGRA